MSIHTKEIIIKSLLVICGVCATLLCPIGIILLIIIAEEWFYMLFNYYTLFLTGLRNHVDFIRHFFKYRKRRL